MQKAASVLLFFIFINTANGQYEEKDFVRYTVKDGLSDNYVTCLQQDEWGYIWIGTDNGLNRFDGYSFRNFYQGSTALPLPSNTIWKLKTMGKDRLGIISLRGLQVLNTTTFALTNFFVPDNTSFTTYSNSALDAAVLPDATTALATATGFYNFSPEGKLLYRFDKYTAADIDKKRILYARKIIPLGNENCIVYVDDDGIASYNSAKKEFTEIESTNRQWQTFYHPGVEKIGYWIEQFTINPNEYLFIQQKEKNIIYYNRLQKKTTASPYPFILPKELDWTSKITQLAENTFAVNSRSGGFFVFYLDPVTGNIHFEPGKYLPNYRVSSLFVDRDKRLWVGTRKGLLYHKQPAAFIRSYHYPVKAPDNAVPGFSDALRYKDQLFLSRFSRNTGLVIVDTASMQIKKSIQFFGNDNMWNEVYSMQMIHPDTLWLGTNRGLLWFDTKSYRYGKVFNENNYPGLDSGMVVLNAPGKDGYAWFCYHLGGVAGRYHIASRTFTFYTMQTRPALPFYKVKSITTDAYGDVWIGGHALARWNSKKQLFDTLIKVYGGVNKFNDDILTLTADDNGSLWLHNTDNGLLEYRIQDKKFISYTMNNGLPSAQIRCMSPVVNNTLWMGSVNYLTQFNTLTKKAIAYNHKDGLPEEFPGSRKIYFDTTGGNFYMFYGDYLAVFPKQLQNSSTASGSILIQELLINNKKSIYHPHDTVTLPYYENNLSLFFNVISFQSPENFRFEYKLNNADVWTALLNNRSINLNQLQPAVYHIYIKSVDKPGKENIKEFVLIITPPVWKTAWFITAMILLGLSAVILTYRFRIKQIRQRANLDKKLAQTEMKALHAQMNPHFIFNSLNSIREMILHNENRDASHYLSKFAQLIRLTLNQSGQAFISLRNTIEYLQRYIEMEKIRKADFTCTISAAAGLDLDGVMLPPMLIQPFIENAIWHGSSNMPGEITITVNFKKEKNQLVCTVDDNGIGINQSLENKKTNNWQEAGKDETYHSVGIDNIKNRIGLLNEKYHLTSSVTIQDKSETGNETGTIVTLHLSLETNEA